MIRDASLQVFDVMTNSKKSPILYNADEFLLTELRQRMQNGENIWSLPERDRHDSGHTFFQYPAMMVPAVQRTLVNVMKTVQPGINSLIDPYVGAGTTLTAGMHNGLNSYGQDINPLAVLVAKVRSGPFFVEALKEHTRCAIETANADQCTKIAVEFPNRQKWFRDDVALELSKLKHAIRKNSEIWARRFMWVTLAETIRLTSNDRTTTYKLHARPKSEIEVRDISPITIFTQLTENNLRDLADYKRELSEKGFVNRGRFNGNVLVVLGDTASSLDGLRNQDTAFFDLLVTSPPYGDNKSTITYGQHAYLPLQWIDLQDIDPNIDKSCLDTTFSIDTHSLGGRRSRNLETQIENLRQSSKNLAITFDALLDKPRDRISRVASFYDDFVKSLDNVVSVLKKNAYLIFTVGNRSVGGIEIPNYQILHELLDTREVVLVTQLERKIHNKRMPHRNQITGMMRTEKILIFRKTTEPGESH
jgi:tRNA G10  N-methylase Trm11